MEKGIVYIIEYNGFYKIGYTKQTLKKRLASYQLPTKPRIVAEYHVINPKKAEKEVHRASAKYHTYNEWFKFDSDNTVLTTADNVLNKYLVPAEDLYGIEYTIKNKYLIEYMCKSSGDLYHIPANSIHIVYGLSNVLLPTIDKGSYVPIMWNNINFTYAVRYRLYSAYAVNTKDFSVARISADGEIIKTDGVHKEFTFCQVTTTDDFTDSLLIAKDYAYALKYPDDAIPVVIPDGLSEQQVSLSLGALETDSDKFWEAYNTAKHSSSRKDWSIIKHVYHKNKIYKRWFRSSYYGEN